MLTVALVAAFSLACGGSDSTELLTSLNGEAPPAITGTVTDANLRPVGGGDVEVLRGGTTVQIISVSSSGAYTVPSLPAGSYMVRLHPPLAYSVGPADAGQRSVDVSANANTPVSVNFVVQAALYADDFQRYTQISQVTGGCDANIPAGAFFSVPRANLGCSNPQQMAIDATGGPNGSSKALRYDWPSRPVCPNGPQNCNYYVALFPRLNQTAAAGSPEIWVRFTDRLSPGFRIGGSMASGAQAEYKYLFIDLSQYGGVGSAVVELDSQQGGPPNQLVQARFKMGSPNLPEIHTDGLPGANGGLDAKLPTDFFGSWNTWVLGLTGLGSPQVTFIAYRNGALLKTITGAFFPNQPVAVGAALDLQMGANINNGPDQQQSRWWRELGIYTSRPSLLPLVR